MSDEDYIVVPMSQTKLLLLLNETDFSTICVYKKKKESRRRGVGYGLSRISLLASCAMQGVWRLE